MRIETKECGVKKPPQALFLDRDGTLIKWVDYLHNPDEVVLEERIGAALRKAKDSGCRLFLHTNQSGVGRGYFPLSAVHAVNEEMFRQMGIGADFFDGICIAPDDPERLLEPTYRKPNPRFEKEMIDKHGLNPTACYMIGDNISDVETGLNAGIYAVGVGGGEKRAEFEAAGALVFDSVAAFVDSIFD